MHQAKRDHVARLFSEGTLSRLTHPEMADVVAMARARLLKPGDDFTADTLIRLAERAAFNVYLQSAEDIGLFKKRSGRELRARLTSNDAALHRGARAECAAAWWLKEVLRLPLTPRPVVVGRRELEFQIDHDGGPVYVEVKAPYRAARLGTGSYDPDSEHAGAIALCMADAVKKLRPEDPNLLVLVPAISWPLPRTVVTLLEQPGFEAIGAVLVVEYRFDSINPGRNRPGKAWLEHSCYVVRSRRNPVATSMWGSWPVYQGPLPIGDLEPVHGHRECPPVATPSVPFFGKSPAFLSV